VSTKEPPKEQRGTDPSLLWEGLGFVVIFSVLQLGWQALHGTRFERLLVHDATVRPAVALANWLTPEVHARAVEFSMRAPGGGLNILNGCEGLEALFLLLAAFSVARLPWSARLWGAALGVLVVFAVNQARILTLFYAYRADHALFDRLHSTVTPIAVVLLVSGYFYAWFSHSARRSPATA
jgi:exosortase/archaeosortase family protein